MAGELCFIPVVSAAQLATVERLAREIWHEHYASLIGREQVNYMVDRFQTAPAMRVQIAEGYEYFLLEKSEKPVGYLAVQPRPAEQALFLSKVYLLASMRGQGAGRRALQFVEQLAHAHGNKRIYLLVNKGNSSRFVYERLGYATVGDCVTDIGGGFVMDDYRMEKILP